MGSPTDFHRMSTSRQHEPEHNMINNFFFDLFLLKLLSHVTPRSFFDIPSRQEELSVIMLSATRYDFSLP
jgi:hypothetical protein